jgi:hypothetical protein
MRPEQITICHCMEREQPGRVTSDARSTLFEHHFRNLRGIAGEFSITHVNRYTSQSAHPSRIQNVDDLLRNVWSVNLAKRGGGIREPTHPEKLSPAPGLVNDTRLESHFHVLKRRSEAKVGVVEAGFGKFHGELPGMVLAFVNCILRHFEHGTRLVPSARRYQIVQ